MEVKLGERVSYRGGEFFVAGINLLNGDLYLENKAKTRVETVTAANKGKVVKCVEKK